MAIVVTNIGANANTSGTTLAVTVPVGGVPTGALIVVAVSDRSATGTGSGSVADTAGNTYTRVTGANFNNNSGNGFGDLFYAKNATALVSGNSITYTKGGSGRCAISTFYATGIDTTAPLDASTSASSFGSSSTPSVTSGTPGAAGELFVGMVAGQGSSGTFSEDTTNGTWVTPFVEGSSGTQSTQGRINGGNQVNAGSSALTYAPGFTSSVVWAMAIAGFKAASGNKTLAAGGGSYSITGTAATPKLGRRTTADAGSYALTGTAATLHKGYVAAAGAGSYALTGTAATLKHAWKPTAGAGSYSLTGTAATLKHGWVIAAGAGSYSLSGVAASLLHAAKITAGAGFYALTGTNATLTKSGALNNYTLAVDAGSYALSGTAASALHGWRVAAGASSYALSGASATLRHGWKVAAGLDSYALSGTAASFVVTRLIVAGSGSYALSGSSAALVYSANDNVQPVTSAGGYGTQTRAKTISRELREKERAARKAARKVRTHVVEALEGLPWFADPEAAQTAIAYVKSEVAESILPQFLEDGLSRSIFDAAVAYLIREATLRAEGEDDDLLLLAA